LHRLFPARQLIREIEIVLQFFRLADNRQRPGVAGAKLRLETKPRSRSYSSAPPCHSQ
jgi:hypothetical protein